MRHTRRDVDSVFIIIKNLSWLSKVPHGGNVAVEANTVRGGVEANVTGIDQHWFIQCEPHSELASVDETNACQSQPRVAREWCTARSDLVNLRRVV